MVTLPPVIWKPSPNFWRGPSGFATRGIVNHRIVGTLPSAWGRFSNPTSNASSHFGIGHNESGVLQIWQFVALDDDAWTNGDVNSPTWPLLIPGVNPNHYTITIEHEDGGKANGGVVEESIWQASIALQVLLASGDPVAVRAAGIRFREDSVVRDLAAISKDELGFIDHHQISGPNKPFCWRPWLDDPGFVKGSPSRRDQLLAALNAAPAEPIKTVEEQLADCKAMVRRQRGRITTLQEQIDLLEAEAESDEIDLRRLRRRLRIVKELAAQISET